MATIQPAATAADPPGRLAFRHEAAHVVGIDIGRHTVTVADLSGLTRASNTQGVTAQMSARYRLTATRRAVRSAPSRANLTEADVVAAGVGSPGPIDAATGVVGICHVLSDWTGQPLSQHVTDLLGCQVAVEKDANLAAIAEIWRGAAPERRNIVSSDRCVRCVPVLAVTPRTGKG